MSLTSATDWPSLSIVIPVYNSERTIPLLMERLAPVLATLTDHFEIILVNDGSRDGSWGVIEAATAQYSYVRGVDMMRNYGQHNALLAGIRLAQHDVVVTMDDDLQHPPEAIQILLAKLAEGYDVVYGVPQRQQHGLLRDLASQITKVALQSAMGADIARNISAFRVMRTSLRSAFDDYKGSFVSIDVLLTWATTRFAAIKVRHDQRTIGVSNYTVRKLIIHALNLITGFSTVPLQLASMIGFACTFLGVVLLAYVLVRYTISGGVVPGFAFLASVITIFSGAQLFALGIIGEYLARIHFRLMRKPTYAVRSTSGRSPKHDSELHHTRLG
jgi:glycosyltransferase involved in cell wall biosynthesis